MVKKRKKPFLKICFIVIIVITLLYVTTLKIYDNNLSSIGNGNVEKIIPIPKGATLDKVADILANNNMIKSKFFFKIRTYIDGLEDQIKHGNYKINDGMTTKEILELLISGKSKEEYEEITLPEGINIFDIAKLFETKNICSKKKFIKLCSDKRLLKKYNINASSIEGYLLPKKYFYKKDAKPIELITKFINTLYKAFPPDCPKIKTRLKKLNLTYHQMLILATFVEEESKIDEERSSIARVFLNRYKKGMLFQCDPTIIYALILNGTWEKRQKKRLSRAKGDMDFDSPYNTYLYKGFPPTPISNPGEKSIEAVLNPVDNKYLFFVLKDSKTHSFATTAREHINNVKKYRKWLKQSKNQ